MTRARVIAAAMVLGAMALGSAAPATTGDPVFGAPVRLTAGVAPASLGLPDGSEPRVAAGSDGRLWIATSDATGQPLVVRSDDGGVTWHPAHRPFDELSAGPDIDIAVTPGGRVVVAGLDGAGFRVITAYSDDGGSSWKRSRGTAFIDQDRPWLTSGPHGRVALLFHNLFSGFVQENMFVVTSGDGGATFGPPVPLTAPGERAWVDLQCGASSGPSSLSANPVTGRLYAVWSTRSGRAAGGCGPTVTAGPGFSVEGADRIWVATSPDGSLGSWTTSLAADDSATQQVLGTLFTPAAVDRAGNVYVAYTESPLSFPDYTGAAVRYRWAPADLAHWSPPVTVAAPGGPGHLAVQVIAGDAGRIDFAYFTGRATAGAPSWFATAAQVGDATNPSPSITEVTLSTFASYRGSADDLAGRCATGPLSGFKQGITCSRATDDFGVARLPDCRLVVTWPAAADPLRSGTWVSVQTITSTAC